MRSLAVLSVHTCPLAAPGGYKTGGMNVYIAELGRELASRGIQVDIFTREHDSATPHSPYPLPPDLPIRVIHLPAGPLESIAPEALTPYLSQFATEVIAFAARESIRYDAIYSHYWLSGRVARDLKKAWQVPVVQMFHTLGIMKDRIAGLRTESERDYAEAVIMAEADRLIAATPAESLQMMTLYGARRKSIAIVPPGVDLTRFTPAARTEAQARLGWATDQKTLLFVGRIEPLKALDSLLESLSLVFADQPDLRRSTRLAVIGGEPTDREMIEMRDLADRLGIAESVSFLGAQPHEVMPDFYRAAEALIMPSDYESFGMSALEAMACGTPVIASEVGGLAYLISDHENGLHVPPRDSSALAHAIAQILIDPNLRDRLGKSAAESAKGYGWPLIADQIMEVINAVS